MAQNDSKIKVLLAQFSLETHSRGILAVAGMLRNAGMEVILIGNALPEQIVETAVQEDVDIIGISTYCGGELVLGNDLIEAAREKGINERVIFLMGGIFPPADIPKLKSIGFGGLFPAGATEKEIISYIRDNIKKRN